MRPDGSPDATALGADPATPTRRGGPDRLSLVGGILFGVLGLAFVLDGTGAVSFGVAWLLPMVLVTLGVLGLAAWAPHGDDGRSAGR